MGKTNYFYGKESEQFAFFTVPKILFCDSEYKELSCEAKLLYGIMLDRMSLSISNNWFDDKNRAYIRISEEFVMENLGCGRNKALNLIKQLEEYDLIERKKLGQGKNSIVYVKRFVRDYVEEEIPSTDEKKEVQKFENQTSRENHIDSEVYNLNIKKFKNQTSRSLENKHQEVYFSNPNNTNINNTKYINTNSNLILSHEDDGIESDEILNSYKQMIKENIDFDGLILSHPCDKKLIEGILNMILEIVISQSEQILIASERYPTALVKSKFMKLNYTHIEYVLNCFKENTTKVRNIKKYLLASLFNAPTTIDGYYSAEVQHDFSQNLPDKFCVSSEIKGI